LRIKAQSGGLNGKSIATNNVPAVQPSWSQKAGFIKASKRKAASQ
jgi:hypothetical protein